MTPDTLDRLEALAAAATPGPWEAHTTRIGRHYVQDSDTYAVAEAQKRNQRGGDGAANAAFIAALDPTTVQQLIAAARLGAAWQAAEAALPEGWWLASLRTTNGKRWTATTENDIEQPLERESVHGPTPAAALLSLAEALRGRNA